MTSMVLYGAASDAVSNLLATHPHCEPELLILRNYLKDVIEPRNSLGHNVEQREDAGWVIRSKGGAEINKATLVKIRKDLASHLGNFVALIEKLRPTIDQAP